MTLTLHGFVRTNWSSRSITPHLQGRLRGTLVILANSIGRQYTIDALERERERWKRRLVVGFHAGLEILR